MVTLIARASLTVCLILAFAGSIHAGDAETIDIFRAGQEADVLALLGPYDEASFEIRGWSLDGVSVGPGCEILFKMVHRGAEERVEVFVVPRASGGPGSFAYRWDGAAGHDAQIAQLRSGFEALVDGNDPGDFFTTRCLTVVTDGEESGLIGALSELLTVDVGAVSPNGAESPAAPPLVEVQEVRPAGKGAIPWLRFLLAISGAIFALWLLRGVRPSRGIRGASTLWQRAPLILLVILALTVRWMVMRGTPLAEYELDNFYVIGLNDLLVFMGLGTQTSLVLGVSHTAPADRADRVVRPG